MMSKNSQSFVNPTRIFVFALAEQLLPDLAIWIGVVLNRVLLHFSAISGGSRRKISREKKLVKLSKHCFCFDSHLEELILGGCLK